MKKCIKCNSDNENNCNECIKCGAKVFRHVYNDKNDEQKGNNLGELDHKKYSSIGGWLVVFGLGLFFQPFVCLEKLKNMVVLFKLDNLKIYFNATQLPPGEFLSFKIFTYISSFFILIFLFFDVLLFIFFMKKNNKFPKMIIIRYILNIIYIILGYIWLKHFRILSLYNSTSNTFAICITTVIIFMCILYFRKSNRVKNTFINAM